VAASLSISGIFPFAGFWSKDEIVASTLHHPVFLVLTLAIAFMTAFYMFRLCFLTFWGEPRDQHRYDHAHESPWNMTGPLIFLGVLAIGAGWVGLPWLHHGFSSFVYHEMPPEHHGPNYLLMVISLIVASSGIGLAWLMYYKKAISAQKMGERFRPLYTLLYNKYYFDELYDLVIIRPLLAFSRFMWSFDAGFIDGIVNGVAWLTILWADIKQLFDTYIVDGAVNGSGWIVRAFGGILRRLQTGRVQFYVLTIATVLVFFGLTKIEFSFKWADWPMMTIIFVIGVLVLGFLARTGADRPRPGGETGQEE
jgi:NADH-quinone oxidoreductase subunit L